MFVTGVVLYAFVALCVLIQALDPDAVDHRTAAILFMSALWLPMGLAAIALVAIDAAASRWR